MQLDLKDLIPGSKWIQSSSGIISEIIQGPFCSIYFKDGKFVSYNNRAQVLRKYIGGLQDPKYLNTISKVNAYNFLYYSQPYYN